MSLLLLLVAGWCRLSEEDLLEVEEGCPLPPHVAGLPWPPEEAQLWVPAEDAKQV